MERRRFLKQWLPNGKLLLLSLTKCHGVPCSLPSRITTKVLKNCKTFSSRPRPRPKTKCSRPRPRRRLHDPRPRPDFHFCPRGASRPRPWSRRTTSLHTGARGHQYCCHRHENLFLSKVINHCHHIDKWNANYNCVTQVKTFYRSNTFPNARWYRYSRV